MVLLDNLIGKGFIISVREGPGGEGREGEAAGFKP